MTEWPEWEFSERREIDGPIDEWVTSLDGHVYRVQIYPRYDRSIDVTMWSVYVDQITHPLANSWICVTHITRLQSREECVPHAEEYRARLPSYVVASVL